MTETQREQWRILGAVSNHLATRGAATAARWWSSPRAELGGRSPSQVLAPGFDPTHPDARVVVRLAEDDYRRAHGSPA